MGERSIVVDEEVFAELQQRAEPLVDDANSVLRRVFKLTPTGSDGRSGPSDGTMGLGGPAEAPKAVSHPATAAARRRKRQPSSTGSATRHDRAPKGSLLAQAAYTVPLLEALLEFGGSAPTAEVVERVGQKLESSLTEVDRGILNSGEVRWKNRVQFVRIGLVKEGYIAKNSSRGVWEITEAGRRRAAEHGGDNIEA